MSSAATRAARTRVTRSSSATRRSRSGRSRAASSPARRRVLGAGCVVDPQVFVDELDELEARGYGPRARHLSGNAHVIMPYHVAIDQAREPARQAPVGTTGAGSAPATPTRRCASASASRICSTRRSCARRSRSRSPRRTSGSSALRRAPLELGRARGAARGARAAHPPLLADTSMLVDRALRDGQRVLFEGAQGRSSTSTTGRTRSSPRRARRGGAATGIGVGPNAHRPGARRREGVRHARRRGAVPDGDRGPDQSASASSATSSAP